MKGTRLHKIKKVYDHQLDALLAQKAELERQILIRTEHLRQIDEQLDQEATFAEAQPDFAFFLQKFAEQADRKKSTLNQEISSYQHRIAQANEEITEAFHEQKRYQVLIDHDTQERLTVEQKEEANMLDELTLIKGAIKES
jgi:hypothetical protein